MEELPIRKRWEEELGDITDERMEANIGTVSISVDVPFPDSSQA